MNKTIELTIKCRLCGSNVRVSKHHIVPIKNGGSNKNVNTVHLCNICHNMIESYTQDYIESGKPYNTWVLKDMIFSIWNTISECKVVEKTPTWPPRSRMPED